MLKSTTRWPSVGISHETQMNKDKNAQVDRFVRGEDENMAWQHEDMTFRVAIVCAGVKQTEA